MHSCTFVRKAGDKYEYGQITVTDAATPKEKRTYVVAGTADTSEEALLRNNMSLKGEVRIKYHGHDLKKLWND